MNELPDLSKKEVDVEAIAKQASGNEPVLAALLEGISPTSKKRAIRENSFNERLIWKMWQQLRPLRVVCRKLEVLITGVS